MRKIVSATLLLLGAALIANCGADSEGSSPTPGGGSGPAGAGNPGDAGQPNAAGTSGGTASAAGTGAGGKGEAGKAPTAGTGDGGGGGGGTSNVGGAGENAGGTGENSGGAGDTAGAGGTAPVSICPESVVDFPKLYAQAICKKRLACCDGDDEETCLKQVTDALAKDVYPELAKSAQDGSVEANCPALEQCVAAIDAADCSEWPKEMPVLYGVPAGEPACRDIIKGKLLPNKACTSNYQCDFGACVGDEGATICYTLAKDGEKCDDEANLCNLATSFCGPANECVPRLPNGAACENIDQCLSRRCDTVDSHKCLAPAPKECKFVPKACAMAPGHVPGSVAWPLLVVGLALTAGARRRRRAPRI